jgi:ATP/maltotriose-dependent transcriptional regulator MalT
VAEGAAMMRSGIDLWLETCSVLTATLLVTGPAWAMASVGDAQAVREYLGIGERLMRQTQERAGEVELMRLRAWLQRHDGDPEAARSTLQDALGVAERQESPFFALRVTLDLVAMARGGRHEASARDGLRRVFDSFSEGFAFAPLQEARRVLDAPPQA